MLVLEWNDGWNEEWMDGQLKNYILPFGEHKNRIFRNSQQYYSLNVFKNEYEMM